MDDKKLYSEEDVINLLTNMNELKTNMIEFMHQYYENFNDVNSEIQNLKEDLLHVQIDCDNVALRAEEACAELAFSSVDREKYLRQVASLHQMRELVEGLQQVHLGVQRLKQVCEDGLSLEEKQLAQVTTELESLSQLLVQKSGLKTTQLDIFRVFVQLQADIKKRVRNQLEELWSASIVLDRMTEGRDSSLVVKVGMGLLGAMLALWAQLDPTGNESARLVNHLADHILLAALEAEPHSVQLITSLLPTGGIEIRLASSSETQDDLLKGLTECVSALVESGFLIVPNLAILVAPTLHGRVAPAVLVYLSRADCLEISSDLQDLLSNADFLDAADTISLEQHRLAQPQRVREAALLQHLAATRRLCRNSILDCEPAHPHPFSQRSSTQSQGDIDLSKIVFPLCQVSKNVLQLVAGIDSQICKYEQVSSDPATRHGAPSLEVAHYLRIVPQMLDLYLLIVPRSNKQALRDIPLAAVVHYNNCMYLAHYCMFWSTRLVWLLRSSSTAPAVAESSTTADVSSCSSRRGGEEGKADSVWCQLTCAPHSLLPIVYKLREAAARCLDDEVRKQRQQLSEMLADFHSFQELAGARKVVVEGAIRKCVRHLGSLSKVYEVLPERVYAKTLGHLVSELLRYVVGRAVDMADMASADADALVSLIGRLLEDLLELMELHMQRTGPIGNHCGDKETYALEHSREWARAKALRSVLGSGLANLESRWTENDTTLKVLTPEELRGLVRALFKNTSLRSRVLDKIQ